MSSCFTQTQHLQTSGRPFRCQSVESSLHMKLACTLRSSHHAWLNSRLRKQPKPYLIISACKLDNVLQLDEIGEHDTASSAYNKVVDNIPVGANNAKGSEITVLIMCNHHQTGVFTISVLLKQLRHGFCWLQTAALATHTIQRDPNVSRACWNSFWILST